MKTYGRPCRVAMQGRCTKFRDPESIIIRGIRMNLKDALKLEISAVVKTLDFDHQCREQAM